jgi:hypothetical protein
MGNGDLRLRTRSRQELFRNPVAHREQASRPRSGQAAGPRKIRRSPAIGLCETARHRRVTPARGGYIRWLALGIALLAATPLLPREPRAPAIIESGHFRIRQPPGEGWKVTTEADRIFLRRDRRADGALVGTTAVLVLRTRPVEEKCGLSAEETAANYCRDEEFDLWVSGQLTGLFGLEDVNREVAIIAGKQLYAMHYHQAFAEEYGGARTDNKMYMYFPDSFRDDNFFYVFLQTEACMRDSCPEEPRDMDETPVRSIIGSLETHSTEQTD